MALTFKHDDNYEDAYLVRTKVFMDEQGFKNEFEDKDTHPSMIHVTAYEGEDVLGCARIFPSALEPGLETAEGRWVFGRLAVLPRARKQGLGSALLEESERAAQDGGAKEIHLHAQCNAQAFYEKSGYSAYGPVEMDEHVPHQWMMKRLS